MTQTVKLKYLQQEKQHMNPEEIKQKLEEIEKEIEKLGLREILNELEEIEEIISAARKALNGLVSDLLEKYCGIALISGTLSSKLRLFCFDRTEGEVVYTENLTPETVKEELKKFVASEKFAKIITGKILKVLEKISVDMLNRISTLLSEVKTVRQYIEQPPEEDC